MINYFFAKKTGNWWMSNFYPSVIVHEGKEYPTSEHLYQALKCDEYWHEQVRLCEGPKQSKVLAHEKGSDLPLNDKMNNMRLAIRLKFDQNHELKEKLLNTTGMIIEQSPYDYLWGEGDGTGVNLMGILLMELRERYVSELEDELT